LKHINHETGYFISDVRAMTKGNQGDKLQQRAETAKHSIGDKFDDITVKALNIIDNMPEDSQRAATRAWLDAAEMIKFAFRFSASVFVEIVDGIRRRDSDAIEKCPKKIEGAVNANSKRIDSMFTNES
jgi:hypothetical protein